MQVSSSVVTKVMSPIKTVVTDASAIVETGLQYGRKAMQNRIKVAEAEPEIASAVDIATLKLPPECFNDAEKLARKMEVYGAKRHE